MLTSGLSFLKAWSPHETQKPMLHRPQSTFLLQESVTKTPNDHSPSARHCAAGAVAVWSVLDLLATFGSARFQRKSERFLIQSISSCSVMKMSSPPQGGCLKTLSISSCHPTQVKRFALVNLKSSQSTNSTVSILLSGLVLENQSLSFEAD